MKIINTNKKVAITSLLIITLLSLLSFGAHAKPLAEALDDALLQVNDFFANEKYQSYSKTIDFFFFALLFTSVYLIGVRHAFKEVNKPEKVIAVLLGFMSAFLTISNGYSVTSLIDYIQVLLYILLFILFWLLLKGMKSKFWRFILALFLTFLVIAFFEGLFDNLSGIELT